MLYTSRLWIPKCPSLPLFLFSLSPLHAYSLENRNLKYALELPMIIADSRYKIYEDFSPDEGRRLGDYLEAFRQAVLAGLEKGGSDPFSRLIDHPSHSS
jgi:hypothetical protein